MDFICRESRLLSHPHPPSKHPVVAVPQNFLGRFTCENNCLIIPQIAFFIHKSEKGKQEDTKKVSFACGSCNLNCRDYDFTIDTNRDERTNTQSNLIETGKRLFIHCVCVQLLFTMHDTLSSQQANQLDTTEQIQIGFKSTEYSDSENQEIHDDYFVHKNTEIWFPGHDKNI